MRDSREIQQNVCGQQTASSRVSLKVSVTARGAAVSAASSGGVSPPAPTTETPGGTPGELAGEDACATGSTDTLNRTPGKKSSFSPMPQASARGSCLICGPMSALAKPRRNWLRSKPTTPLATLRIRKSRPVSSRLWLRIALLANARGNEISNHPAQIGLKSRSPRSCFENYRHQNRAAT